MSNTRLENIENPLIRALFDRDSVKVGDATIAAINALGDDLYDDLFVLHVNSENYNLATITEKVKNLIATAQKEGDLNNINENFEQQLRNYMILKSRTDSIKKLGYPNLSSYLFTTFTNNPEKLATLLSSQKEFVDFDNMMFQIAGSNTEQKLKNNIYKFLTIDISTSSEEFKGIWEDFERKSGPVLPEEEIIEEIEIKEEIKEKIKEPLSPEDISYIELETKIVNACKAYIQHGATNEAYAKTGLELAGLLNDIASINPDNTDEINRINQIYEAADFAVDYKNRTISAVSVSSSETTTTVVSRPIQPVNVLKLRAQSLLIDILVDDGIYKAEHISGNSTAATKRESLATHSAILRSVMDQPRETLETALNNSLLEYNRDLKLTEEQKNITQRINALKLQIANNLTTNPGNAEDIRTLQTTLTSPRDTWMTAEQIAGFETQYNTLVAQELVREDRETEARIEEGHNALDTEITNEINYYSRFTAFNNPEINRRHTELTTLSREAHPIDQGNLTRRRNLFTPLKATAEEKALNLRTMNLEVTINTAKNAIPDTDRSQATKKSNLERLRQEVVRSWTLRASADRTSALNDIESRYNVLSTASRESIPVEPEANPDGAPVTVETPTPSLTTTKRMSRDHAGEFAVSFEKISKHMNNQVFDDTFRKHYMRAGNILKDNEVRSPLLNLMSDYKDEADPTLKKKKYNELTKQLNSLDENTDQLLDKVDKKNKIEDIVSKEINLLVDRAENIVARPALTDADRDARNVKKNEHIAICLEAITQIHLIEGKLAKQKISDTEFNKSKRFLDTQIGRLYDEIEVLKEIPDKNLIRTHAADTEKESYHIEQVVGDDINEQIAHIRDKIREHEGAEAEEARRDALHEGFTVATVEDVKPTSSYSMMEYKPENYHVDPKIKLTITEKATEYQNATRDPNLNYHVQFVSGKFGGKNGVALLHDDKLKYGDLEDLIYLAGIFARKYDTLYGDQPGKQMAINKNAPPRLQAVLAVYCENCFSVHTGEPYREPKTPNRARLDPMEIMQIKLLLKDEGIRERITGRKDIELTHEEKVARETPAPEKSFFNKFFPGG